MTSEKITSIKCLIVSIINPSADHNSVVKIENLNSLTTSKKLIEQLAKSNNLAITELNGELNVRCFSDTQFHNFFVQLVLNKII